jgi:hypothetical protein
MALKDLNYMAVMRALSLPAREARELLSRMLEALPNNEALRGRVVNAGKEGRDTIDQEIRLFNALEKSWKSGPPDGKGSEFRFEEIQDFTPPLKWDKHEGSYPDKLFRVHMRQEDGSWLALPINVGARMVKTPTVRQGHGKFLKEHPFLTLEGELPRTAVVSGYVHDHKDPLISDPFEDPKTGRKVERGLRGKDIRGKVETAFMHMLYSTGTGLTQSSILFNVRDNPIKGMIEALRALYIKFNKLPGSGKKDLGFHTVLPPSGTFNPVERAKNREAKHRGDEGKVLSKDGNGAVWIAYLDPKTMDMTGVTPLDVKRAFASKECEWLSKLEGEYPKEPPLAVVAEYYAKIKRVTYAAYGKGKNPLREAILAGDGELLPGEVFSPENLLMSGGGKLAERGPNVHLMANTPDASKVKAGRAADLADKLNQFMNDCVLKGCRVDPQAEAAAMLGALQSFAPDNIPAVPAEFYIDDFKYELQMVQSQFDYVGLDDARGQDISELGSSDQLGHVPPESFTKEVLLCCNAEGKTLVEVMAEKGRLDLVPKPSLKEALDALGIEGVDMEDLLDRENIEWSEVVREHLAAAQPSFMG